MSIQNLINTIFQPSNLKPLITDHHCSFYKEDTSTVREVHHNYTCSLGVTLAWHFPASKEASQLSSSTPSRISNCIFQSQPFSDFILVVGVIKSYDNQTNDLMTPTTRIKSEKATAEIGRYSSIFLREQRRRVEKLPWKRENAK